MASSNINKVAINTIIQYVELILNVLIGLVSVRLILNALGASDYGIYDLIGGIVALLGFITTTLSQTSMRFLSVSLGAGNNNEIRKTFSSCFWLHIYIGSALAVILSVVGLFLFNGALNIPADRTNTARIIYYVMTLNLFVSIATTPFTALLYSHEKFVYVSCIRIMDSVIKLLIAVVITYYAFDKLLLYGFLMAGITVIDTIFYISYTCIKYQDEMSFVVVPPKSMKAITGFAGWTVLDVMGTVASRQGFAILLNGFFGTVVNAVFALARQIEGHMYTISASVINTMKPQIMKSQGAGDSDRMFRLSMTAGKIGFTMMSFVAIPLMVMMPEVLTLWLKDVPEGTVLFTRLMVLACMFEQLTRGLVYANQAVGNIKWFSISISLIRILALPISWILFRCGAPAYTAIVVFLICETIGSLSRVFILSKITDFDARSFIQMVVVNVIPPFLISLTICILVHFVTNGFWGLVVSIILTVIPYMMLVYIIGLNKGEREAVSAIIKTLLKKIHIDKQLPIDETNI